MPQHDIDITTMSFPADTRVAKGDTVRWTNKMGMTHTVTADEPPSPPAFDSGNLATNESSNMCSTSTALSPTTAEFIPRE